MGMIKKYIFVNGVMMLNPDFKKQQQQQGQGQSSTAPAGALAVVSSFDDVAQASQQQQHAVGAPMAMALATQASMDIMQDEGYNSQFGSPVPFQPGEVLDGLTAYFSQYEVPLGMVNKLCMLSEYSINFIIDDSGSMNAQTDANTRDAGTHMRRKLGGQQRQMTRWEEVQDRVHILVEILKFVPTGSISVSFMNRRDRQVFNRQGKTPDQFEQGMHQELDRLFASPPTGLTPTLRVLTEAFRAQGNVAHYFFTDGCPSDTQAQEGRDRNGKTVKRFPQIEQLVMSRRSPQQQPLSLLSCTNDDDQADWMKILEESAPFTTELDDFHDERAEIMHDQGPAFPYTKGFWLICMLVSALCPDDLDAMDDSAPFSKMTMDNMLGRVLTEQDYQHYFRAHPQEPVVRPYYQEFATAQKSGKKIWQEHRLKAGPPQKVAPFQIPSNPNPHPPGYQPGAPPMGAPGGFPPQGGMPPQGMPPGARPPAGYSGAPPGYPPQGGVPGYPPPPRR